MFDKLKLMNSALMTLPIMIDRLPGSPVHRENSEAVDQAVDDSFPASDPPASRLPDDPPANAEAKWAAAREAGKAPK